MIPTIPLLEDPLSIPDIGWRVARGAGFPVSPPVAISRLPTKEKAAVEWCEKRGVEGSIEMIFVPVREGNFELSTDAP